MKLSKYIKASNKLIEMPYNKLNLENVYSQLCINFKAEEPELYAGEAVTFKSHHNVMELMSGGPAPMIETSWSYKEAPQVFLVGKGVLFDSGGYSLKPPRAMQDMHTDMAGMSIATATSLYCKKELNLPVESYSPTATNFLHTSKINVGDILHIGKKKVKVTNTDAEGRLILAQALSNLTPFKDSIIVTIATLTGACAAAIGEKATAVMSPNKTLVKQYLKASRKAGELAWELPLFSYLQKEFDKKLITNTSSRRCGTIMAGMFLKQFVPNPKNWLHLDIAYSSYDRKKQHATGQPIKSLVEFMCLLNKEV